MTHKRKQADSLFIDYPFPAWKKIDSVWANWSGLWTISVAAGDDILLSGTLSLSATPGIFNLRIGPATIAGWAVLPVGSYTLTAEFNNTSVDYRYEEQDRLIIVPQGVPNV